jgi:hypothetical protein
VWGLVVDGPEVDVFPLIDLHRDLLPVPSVPKAYDLIRRQSDEFRDFGSPDNDWIGVAPGQK